MFPSDGPRDLPGSRLSLRHALAGLQAGVLGALVMLFCLMAGSSMNHRSVWATPNLLSTLFYGSAAYQNEYTNTSFAGAALLIAIYGGLGVLWGIAWREERKPALALFGAVFGLAVYFLFFHGIWKAVAPVITLYAPDRQLELGHILWGITLGKSPVFARRIADQMADPVVPEEQPDVMV